MVCLPATQFGCGCTVTFGVKFILLLNLAINLLIMACCISFLIFGMKGMALGGYGSSIAILGFTMAGVPIIVMAFNGVRYRNEAQIRMYLYYMWLIIAATVYLIVTDFVLTGPCQRLAGTSLSGLAGSAWACGMARYADIFFVVVSLSILCYFQHVVYSHCEDITEVGGGPELKDLVLNRDFYRFAKRQDTMYASVEGLAEYGETSALGFMGLDSSIENGIGGSQNIFGVNHDMNFPPGGHSNIKSA